MGKSSQNRHNFPETQECFLDQKSEVSKSPKIRKFLKGYSTVFCQKLELFTMCIFCANEATKDCFFNIVDRKECLLDKKSDVSKKVRKIEIFQRVKSMVFVKKSNLLPRVFVGQIKPEKIVFWYSGLKKMLFRPKKWRFKKLKKNRTFPKRFVNGFCVKIQLFTMCVFWANQVSKDRFLIFWIEANAF